MHGMNPTRILLGGLVAGLVINVGETLLNMVVIADEMQAMIAAAGGGMTSWAMPMFITMAFVWGILFVAAYAAIRPRFGAGWQTAVIAGTTMWVVGNLLPTLGLLGMGIGAASPALTSVAWGFFEFNLATVAGAAVYQEARAAQLAAQAARPPIG